MTVGDGVQGGATAGQHSTTDDSGASAPGFQLGKTLIQTPQPSILTCWGIPTSQVQTSNYFIWRTKRYSSFEAQSHPRTQDRRVGGISQVPSDMCILSAP